MLLGCQIANVNRREKLPDNLLRIEL